MEQVEPDVEEQIQEQEANAQPQAASQVVSEGQETDTENEVSTENLEPDTPDWFMKDKYKSVEEQAKSAFELQKKMGKYWGKSSDEYTIEGIEGVQKDDPLLANLSPALQEIGLSQEGFNHLIKEYQQANVKMMQGYEEQLKKELTEKDVHTYQSVNKWMNESFNKEEIEQIQNNWLMTPKDFQMFNQLRLMMGERTNVPSSTGNNAVKFESSQEVENDKVKYKTELKQGLRAKDKNYENDLAARFRDARTRELRKR